MTIHDIEALEHEYTQLKNKSFDVHRTKSSNEVMKGIMKVKDMSDEMQELIILLYSNYKAELDLIKQNNLELTNKQIDLHIKLLNRIKMILKNDAKETKTVSKPSVPTTGKVVSFFNSLPNNIKTMVVLMGGLVVFVLLFKLFPNEVKGVFELFKEFFLDDNYSKISK